MPPRLLPTPQSSPYVEQLLAQPVDAFGRGAQNAQFAAQLANALATGYGAYKGRQRERATGAELADILSQAVAPQTAPLTDAVAGQFEPRLPPPAPRSRADQQEFVRGSLLGSDDPAIQRMGTEFALKNIMSDAPPLETTELFPPKGSGPEARTIVATNPAQVRRLVLEGYTLTDQRPDPKKPTSLEEKITLFEGLGIPSDRARVLAVGGEEPQFDPTSNRFIGTYDLINQKFTPVAELISGEGAPEEEGAYTGHILLDPATYPAEGSLLSNLDQFGFAGSTREIIAKSPIARKAVDEWFVKVMEGGADLLNIEPPAGLRATQEEVVNTRTKYRQFQNDAIRALRQASRVSVPEQQRIINMLPDLGWWENPDSAGAALRSIAHNMGEVLKANVAYGEDAENPTGVRTEAQSKAWAISAALRQIGFSPVGSNFVTKEGIEQLTFQEIQEAPPVLIKELMNNSPELFQMIVARKNLLTAALIESGELLPGVGE